jgi:hypothetical protein
LDKEGAVEVINIEGKDRGPKSGPKMRAKMKNAIIYQNTIYFREYVGMGSVTVH